MTVKEINNYALHGKKLPQAVSTSKRLLYDQLTLLYRMYRLGADEKEVATLRKQLFLQFQKNEQLEKEKLELYKKEQENIRKSEEYLTALCKCDGNEDTKLRLACLVIASMRGGCEKLYELIGGK